MRRLVWLGLGVAAGAAGPRWVTRRARHLRRQQGLHGPLPIPDAVGATATAAGRVAARATTVGARATSAGARRVGAHVRRAVDGGRQDARAREERLRRALAERPTRAGDDRVRRTPAPPHGPARAGGPRHGAR